MRCSWLPPPALLEGESLDLPKPLLVLTGERDELAPPEPLRAALDGRSGARLVVVPEADHFFVAGLAHIGREAGGWLEDPLA